MKIVLITGSGGLIGSEASTYFLQKGFKVIGIDNNMRSYFFGEEANTLWKVNELKKHADYTHFNIDIRDYSDLESIFKHFNQDIKLTIHTAAQPSHDWAAREPITDFTINANGTLNLLELCRRYCQDASFIFTSTNKVYGDRPNSLPLVELETRWEIDPKNKQFQNGIDEQMSIDNSKHSLFGASKVAADILVQEYGKYFGMNTVSFRGGCLTGPAHSGAELHGFLAYLVKCTLTKKPYTIFGYKGKQVRDNIHSFDLINAFWEYYQNPRKGEVYNIGGSRQSNTSILEAIESIAKISGSKLDFRISTEARVGDHIWYISDVAKFKDHYPKWDYKYNAHDILLEIIKEVDKRLSKNISL